MKCFSFSARFISMLGAAMLLLAATAHAGTTDIANAPLATASSTVVKPNIMFILDDSGSMQWSYLGDDVYDKKYVNTVGYRNHLCNKAYYDPNTIYTPPVAADGTQYATTTFSNALYDGYTPNSVTVNLGSEFMAWRSGSSNPSTPRGYDSDCWDSAGGQCQAGGSGTIPNAKEPAYYFVYKGSKLANLGDGSSNDQCKDTAYDTSATSGAKNWYKVVVSSSSGTGPAGKDERQNFANWYSFYRTRILMMKTSVGLAFKSIGSNYRVGFSTISETGVSDNTKFQHIADFDATQRGIFYQKLYGISPSGGTPLRDALAKVGRMYAGQLLTGTNDPVQYSCQQNFSILSTDGYWSDGTNPVQIDGSTAIGNQDGDPVLTPLPMFDGTITTPVTTATLTVSGNSSTSVTSIQVGKLTITSGTTNASKNSSAVAANIAAAITVNGFKATVDPKNNNRVIITAPLSLGPITDTPVITFNGKAGMTISATSFSTTPVTNGGASNTLADVAAYYYNNDLRPSGGVCSGGLGVDVCKNNVTGSDRDTNQQQHMTTFTLGLGVNGTLKYSENYLQGGSADFEAIKKGDITWTDPIKNTGAERVDDLWHAAVNGHGTYFSAQDPASLVTGLSKALAGVKARAGSAAAAATSNLEPVAGDNYVYVALYRTMNWDGDLQAKTIDPYTGDIATVATWSAQQQLDTLVTGTSDSRTIYTFDGTASNRLKSFNWNSLNATEQAYFNNVCVGSKLSQCPDLTTAQLTVANSGANLVNFIRGQTGYEDQDGNDYRVYRDREHVLGDMVSSQPVYVKTPPFGYVDANYSAFRDKYAKTASQEGRTPMVYVAVNDGMLHAFNGLTGIEAWAYIPPIVMSNLYKLADKNYAVNHQYYVDGSPTVGDICPKAPSGTCTADEWKTILVGGLNAGGRAYYALDITDPLNPKALWNFSAADDGDLGYTFGNPIITKRKDGTWVVVVTSGYNNVPDANVATGSGKGYLYVLNANTGKVLEKISTNAGDTTTPSGLAKINAWIDTTTNNTAKRFYGGDLLGNVWRFDVDDVALPAGKEALKIAELGNVGAVGVQPVTIKPELTEVTDKNGTKYAVVNIATGRYLGTSDKNDTSQQSIYAFKDNMTDTGLGRVRTTGVLTQQQLVPNTDGTTRTTTNNAVDWSATAGWYIDLNPSNQSPGERVNVDMQQQQGLLVVAANVPENNACTPSGYAWLYYFDYMSGKYVQGATNKIAGQRLAQNALVAGIKTIKLKTGKTTTLITDTDGGINSNKDDSSGPGAGTVKRVSWRELVD